MRRQFFLILFTALMLSVSIQAQQISVVSSEGNTSLYKTLQEAIDGAESGSVVYLPGGSFQISDDVKITKKLTIIGIGHKSNGDNADGVTIISGNLWFNEGSSGSAVMGCYITGSVVIGEDAAVDNVIVKYCNLKSVDVRNSDCLGTFINQNYIRQTSYFGKSAVTLTNNVLYSIYNINGGVISYNIIILKGINGYAMYEVYNSRITYNIFSGRMYGCHPNNLSNENFYVGGSWGDNPVVIDADINDILVNVNDWSVSPNSNFHFTEDYKEYENKVGIYAGSGFKEDQMAPVPYITFKDIPDQTDASGKLNIKIRVKAGK